jgi:poly(A) polymerase
MFYDPLEDRLHDFVGGREDIAGRLVRAIGNPQARFTEDKLRMLRAVRITARFDFELESATAAAVRAMASQILVVSQERIAQELKKMLVHARRARAISLAHHLELLTVILPELSPVVATAGPADRADRWKQTLELLEILKDPRFELAFAALLSQSGEPEDDNGLAKMAEVICRRLKLSNQEVDDVAWLTGHRNALRGSPSWPKSRLKRLLAQPAIDDLLKLARASAVATGGDLDDIAFCEEHLATTPREELDPPPLISGDDLVAMGLQPGAQFKELLDAVRDAQLDGQIWTGGEALTLVRRLVGR